MTFSHSRERIGRRWVSFISPFICSDTLSLEVETVEIIIVSFVVVVCQCQALTQCVL